MGKGQVLWGFLQQIGSFNPWMRMTSPWSLRAARDSAIPCSFQNSERCTHPMNTWIQEAELPRRGQERKRARPLMVRKTVLSKRVKETVRLALQNLRSAHLQATSSSRGFQFHLFHSQGISEGNVATVGQSPDSRSSLSCPHFLRVKRARAPCWCYLVGNVRWVKAVVRLKWGNRYKSLRTISRTQDALSLWGHWAPLFYLFNTMCSMKHKTNSPSAYFLNPEPLARFKGN